MKAMNKIITSSISALLLAALGANISFAGKPTGGGGGKKVAVESATPNAVIQTAEEDVTILGSGFDNGSKVRFLVTGTTDDSQIEVGPAQYISSNELKVHIKTNGSTATVDYDIEVQATSGRKGKGTTLFKVQQSGDPTSCEHKNSAFPAFAYVNNRVNHRGRSEQSFYVSNADGDCSILIHTSTYDGTISLKYTQVGNSGIIAWSQHKDENAGRKDPDIDRIKMLRFNLSGKQVVSDLPLSSTDVYVSTFPGNGGFKGVSITPDGTKIVYSAGEVSENYITESLNELNIAGCSANCWNSRIFDSTDSYHHFLSYNVAGDRLYFDHLIYDLYGPGIDVDTVSFIEFDGANWSSPRIVLQSSNDRYDPVNYGADVSFSDISVANVDLENDGSFEKVVSFRVYNSALNLSTTEIVDTTNCAVSGPGTCLQSGESFILQNSIDGYHCDLTNFETLLCTDGNIVEYDLVTGVYRTVTSENGMVDAAN